MKCLKKEVESTNVTLEDWNLTLIDPMEKLDLCKSVVTDIALWDQCIDETEKYKRKINAHRQSLNYSMHQYATIFILFEYYNCLLCRWQHE